MPHDTPADWIGKIAGVAFLIGILLTFNGRRDGGFFERFAGSGLGEGTPYFTTWNVMFFLVGLTLAGVSWWARRR